MASTFCNDARSKVASGGGRSIGGTTLTVVDGSKYQDTAGNPPSPSAPARLTVIRWSGSDYAVVTVLKCTGRSGNVLTIDGATDGYADAAVLADDVAMCGPTAGDLEKLQADNAANATAIAGKQGTLTLTTTGTSGAASLTGSTLNIPQYAAGTGTVTTVSVVSANGFGGSVATATTTPTITLTCSITGLLKGDGTAIVLATAGVDYVSPSGLSSALASYVALTGAQTLYDKSTQSSGSGDQLKHLNTLGVQASGVDKDGNEGAYDLSYLLAAGIDLAAGASASRIAAWPGKIAEICIKASVNGSSGGFTLTVAKNGSTIATQAVVASNTSLVTIASGSISDLAIAKGDVFAVSCASSPAPGTGVQSVEVYIKHGRRNR